MLTRPKLRRQEGEQTRGAGRDRRGEGLDSTTPQLLFGRVSLDHKP